MKKTILIGGGGHAISVLQAMGKERFEGYAAASESSPGPGVPYMGNDKLALELDPSRFDIHIAVGFTGKCSLELRRRLIADYSQFEAPVLISPHAVVTPMSSIGSGTAVMLNAVVNGATLGSHCVVNTGAIIEHGCRLGSNVFVGPGAVICGETTIADDVFIGAGALIRNGVSLATGVKVAMGAVVTHSLNIPGIYAGNPARPLSEQ